MGKYKSPIPLFYAFIIALVMALLATLHLYLQLGHTDNARTIEFIQRSLMINVVNYCLWAALSPVVYYYVKKYRVYPPAPLQEIGLAVLASLILASFHEVISNVIYYIPRHYLGYQVFDVDLLKRIIALFPAAMVARFMEYWILYAFFSAFLFQTRLQAKQLELAQMETALSQSKLRALRLQLQPHFLFNTLNTISSLIEIDKNQAQSIVAKLGKLLRKVLDSRQKSTVSIAEEIGFLQNYLDIEQIRFSDRLTVNYTIDPTIKNFQIPYLILQPLVENAIKHGITPHGDPTTITITTKQQENQIILSVKDDGLGSNQTQEKLSTKGIGIKNISNRLKLLYKEEANFVIQTKSGFGFEAIITLPIKEEIL